MNRSKEGYRKYRRMTLIFAIALCTVAAGLNTMMMQTSLRPLISDLGSVNYEWISTIFILCECIAMPITGMLIDRYGKRGIFALGCVLFVSGALLCTVSTSMNMFLFFRAMEGAGCGISVITSLATVGDLYEPDERIRMHCIMAAAFGLGLLYGVFFGDHMTSAFGWEYGFYITAAVFAASAIIALGLMEPVERSMKKIDIPGLAVLSAITVDVILYFQWINNRFVLTDVESIVMIVTAAFLVTLLIFIERGSSDPYIPKYVGDRKALIISLVSVATLGIFVMGSVNYIARMSVITFNLSISETAVIFIWMILGVLITSFITRSIVSRIGTNMLILIGAVISAISILSISSIHYGDDSVVLAVHIFILGLGMGFLMALLNTTLQNNADPKDKESVISLGMLIRTVGTFVGSAFYLSLIDNEMSAQLDGVIPSVLPTDSNILMLLQDPAYHQILYVHIDRIIEAFTQGVGHSMVIGSAMITLILIISTTFIYMRSGSKRLDDM